LHFALAPVGSVLPAVEVGADFVAVEVLAAVVEAAGAAGVLGAAAAGGAAFAAGVAAFCTPPWPLQVPLPVEVVVVPSLQVVSAKLGIDIARTNRGAATRPATVIFFMKY
jgi:hypothetical protein